MNCVCGFLRLNKGQFVPGRVRLFRCVDLTNIQLSLRFHFKSRWDFCHNLDMCRTNKISYASIHLVTSSTKKNIQQVSEPISVGNFIRMGTYLVSPSCPVSGHFVSVDQAEICLFRYREIETRQVFLL